MKYFGEGISEKHKELNKIIRKPSKIAVSKSLFLEIHALLNQSIVSDTAKNEVDELLEDLEEHEYAIMPTSKDETIAWVLWHISRIEDLTMNFLIGKQDQIFNQKWKEKLRVSISDTGNSLSDDEIMRLSKKINKAELVKNAGGVTQHPDSIWLIDFWGKKDVSGILLISFESQLKLYTHIRHQITRDSGVLLFFKLIQI